MTVIGAKRWVKESGSRVGTGEMVRGFEIDQQHRERTTDRTSGYIGKRVASAFWRVATGVSELSVRQ
jgi:hypothetical protein